ncbi:MAG: hypothetical protein HUJ54_12705 [Erysipelotrichaceae bacterium]|nr:hypothetical protein [Erysipelotrichaceae bacterium]
MKRKFFCMLLSICMILPFAVPQVLANGTDTYDPSKIYHGGDVVVYQGIEYTAKWYTHGEIPGDGFNAWERARETDQNGNTVWGEGMVCTAKDRVSWNGAVYEAKWWTQSVPGSDSSWILISGTPTEPTTPPTEPETPVDPTEPANPTNPAEPADPVDPSDSDIPTWHTGMTCIKGDRVYHNGILYEAKWWTQSEPGSDASWHNTNDPGEDITPSSPAVSSKTVYSDYTVSESLVAQGPNSPVIVGYLPTYRASFEKDIDWACLTHVIYSFGSPNGKDGLQPLENPQLARTLVAHGHANNVSVLFGVGGWADNFSGVLENVFYEGTATEGQIESLTDDIVEIVNAYGFDGVDIDWEHPRISSDSWQRYEAFMIRLREKLGPDMILTSAVLPGVDTLGGIYPDGEAHTANVMAVCNWFNVMAYEANSTMAYSQACINYWCQTRQMPLNKVVLGAPFYSQGGYALTYAELLAQYPEAAASDMEGTGFYHNCPQTLYDKTTWALNHGLGGMMVWELGQDLADPEDSLIRAIYNAVCDFEGVEPLPFIQMGDDPIPGSSDPYEWSSAAFYTAGDRVNYNGAVYEALWWTKTIPGSDSSWKLISGTPQEPDNPSVNPPADPETPTEPPAAEIPTWYEGLVRMSGDKVYYNDHLYQAKWWTQSVPGSDESWILIS